MALAIRSTSLAVSRTDPEGGINSVPVSNLGRYIVCVVIDESTPVELVRYKVLRAVLYTFGTGLSFASCIVPSYIAWRYDTGVKGIEVLELGGILGVVIDFGIFGAYGYVLIARRLVEWKSRSGVNQVIFNENATRKRRIAHICVSTLWGGSSRLVGLGLGLKFANSLPLGIVGAIGGAGPALWSAFQSIGRLIDKTKDDGFFSTASERHLRRVKAHLLVFLTQCRQAFLNMPEGEAKERLFKLLTDRSHLSEHEKVQTLFTEMARLQAIYKQQIAESCLVSGPRRVTNVISLLPSTMMLLQLWLLANTAGQHFIADQWISSVVVTIAVSSFVLFAYSETLDCSSYLYNRIVGQFASVQTTPTDAEVVFGRASLLLDILGIGLALLPYADLISISQQYASEETMFNGTTRLVMDNTFVYGSYVGWVMLIFQSARKLLIPGIARRFAQSSCSSTDVQRTMIIDQKLEQLLGIITEANLQSCREFTNDLDPSFLPPQMRGENMPLLLRNQIEGESQ